MDNVSLPDCRYRGRLTNVVVTSLGDGNWTSIQRFLMVFSVIWIVTSVLELTMTWWVFRPLDYKEFSQAVEESESEYRSRIFHLIFGEDVAMSWSLVVSLNAMLIMLVIWFTNQPSRLLMALTVVGVITAWLVVVFAYAMQYARANTETPGSFEFPGTPEPTFSDYLSQSITVTTSTATGDVVANGSKTRALMAGNSFVGFVFNTIILAFLLTIIADDSLR